MKAFLPGSSSQRLLRCASSSNYNTTYNAFSPLRQQITPNTSRGDFCCVNPKQTLAQSPLMKVNELNSQIGELTLEINVLKEYLSGESYSNIAKKLDIQKKSVDNALGRIRQKLSIVLDDNNNNI